MLETGLDPELIKKSYEDKSFTINDVTYEMLDLSNEVALDIIGAAQLVAQSGAVVNSQNWKLLQKKLFDAFKVGDSLLSRLPKHFEEHKSNYFSFISYAATVVNYPFTPGA